MARKLVSVQKVLEVSPIEGADMIEKIKVLGWNLVTQKSNGFKPGDMVVYFEIDSFLPVRPEWEFLRKSSYRKLEDGTEGFRIKTAKFKGQVSQGFALPLKDLQTFGIGRLNSVPGENRWDTVLTLNDGSQVPIEEGTDLTEIMGVTKFEPPIPACLSGTAKGYTPSWMITDETRVQLLQGLLDRYKGREFYVTEKLDGSSFTAFLDEENNLHVCSRQLDLEKDENNTMWKWAIANDIESKLRKQSKRLAIQGEIVGEGIQGNRYNFRGQDVRFFNAVDMDKREHLGLEDLRALITDLGLQMVPMVGYVSLVNDIDQLVESSYGKSLLAPSKDREGIVLRPLDTITDASFDVPHSRVSFKVINPAFLLKGGD